MKNDTDLRENAKSTLEYVKRAKEAFHVLRWVWQDLASAKARWLTKFMIAACAIDMFVQLASSYVVQYVFNGLATHDMRLVVFGFCGYLAYIALNRIADFGYETLTSIVSFHVNEDVSQRATQLFFEKSLGQHLNESSGLSHANLENGLSKAKMLIETLVFAGTEQIIRLALSFVLVCIISPVAGLIIGIAGLTHVACGIYLNRKLVEGNTPNERARRKLNRHRFERWEMIERVKTTGKEDEELEEMDLMGRSIIAADYKLSQWYRVRAVFRGCVTMIGLMLAMAYGAWLVWDGQWLVGKLFPLYMWASNIAFNIWQLSSFERRISWNIPAVSHMKDSLTMGSDIVSGDKVVCHRSPVRIAFDQVTYTYPCESMEESVNEEKPMLCVLRNVSFEIAAGEKVALIGSSGVGKTTIMRLLLRYVDPDQGCIHVNGYKLCDVNLASWMKLVGYIPQHPQVLDGTIRYNLTYGLPAASRAKVTDEELWRLMRLLQIDFGARLTDGLDTVVGRNGIKLSGGQAQRLMIGAAAIKRPLFMIIDEATSSLDSTTERLVHDGLVQILSGNVSALVIAHRLSTVRDLCDKYVVLRESTCLAESDSQVEATASTFEELYRISPTFRRLADDQGIAI